MLNLVLLCCWITALPCYMLLLLLLFLLIIFLFCILCFLSCRNVNGFLNSGRGGIIYLGISNNTTVNGIPLSSAQVSLSMKLEDIAVFPGDTVGDITRGMFLVLVLCTMVYDFFSCASFSWCFMSTETSCCDFAFSFKKTKECSRR